MNDSEVILFLFQFTLPCGERHYTPDLVVKKVIISIHAPVWGATREKIPKDILFSISIHAPVWGATVLFSDVIDKLLISIHAPVWGATMKLFIEYLKKCISIHAPVWGATLFLAFSI